MTKDRIDLEELEHDLKSFEPEHDDEQYDLEYNFTDDSNAKAMEQIGMDMESDGDELLIVALNRKQVMALHGLWGEWSEVPSVNFTRMREIANDLLVSINNAEALKGSGHHYVMHGKAQDCFNAIKEGKL